VCVVRRYFGCIKVEVGFLGVFSPVDSLDVLCTYKKHDMTTSSRSTCMI
jgi:hypothetical protein